MRFEFRSNASLSSTLQGSLALSGRRVPIVLVRNPRAHRYVLRLRPDGSARLTIPSRGSMAGARRFAEQSAAWLQRELDRLDSRPMPSPAWLLGAEILLRGIPEPIELLPNGEGAGIRLGDQIIRVADSAADLRPEIERHLWRLASSELPPRVLEHAARHQLAVRRITVRNQRSRWGSCSPRGTVSLNWRLMQTPPFVTDYVILHELMHLRQMNHSPSFWREVECACPGYRAAEAWLNQHASLLR